MKVLLLLYYAAVLATCAFVATSASVRSSTEPPPPRAGDQQRPATAPPIARTDPSGAASLVVTTAGASRPARVIAQTAATKDGVVEPLAASSMAGRGDAGSRSSNEGGPGPLAPGQEILVLVVLAGALGGVLHGLTSLAAHSGSGRLDRRWWVFYVARPVVGGGLALVVALVLRAGLLGISVADGAAGSRVLLAWGALAGIFSSPALKKLKDVFDGFGPKDGGGNSKGHGPSNSGPGSQIPAGPGGGGAGAGPSGSPPKPTDSKATRASN